MARLAKRDESEPTQKGAVAARAFSLLRTTTDSWRMDSSGLWSYPAMLPATEHGSSLWLMLVAGTVPMPAKQRTAVFRPKAAVITKAAMTRVVRYESFREGHDPFPSISWDKPIAMFPHKSVGKMTVANFRQKEASLLAMYPDATVEWEKTGKLPNEFRELHLTLLHPLFLPYLRHLAPRFFRALGVDKSAATVAR
jgi:hypothetical protein